MDFRNPFPTQQQQWGLQQQLAGTAPASPQFDIIAWYPQYQSCLRYFLDVSQHGYPCQALAAFLNIKLPFQKTVPNVGTAFPGGTGARSPAEGAPVRPWISLIPYIRRLVATGFDGSAILHGWFGDSWQIGVSPLHDQERRNFLFAAKSGGWLAVKQNYDMDPTGEEGIPFIRPLDRVIEGEVDAAETNWSAWLAMEDWMLGPGREVNFSQYQGGHRSRGSTG